MGGNNLFLWWGSLCFASDGKLCPPLPYLYMCLGLCSGMKQVLICLQFLLHWLLVHKLSYKSKELHTHQLGICLDGVLL